MNAQDYHRQLVAQIDSISAIVSSEISFREIDEKEIPTFPFHRHTAADQIQPSREMSPADAVAESLAMIESRD